MLSKEESKELAEYIEHLESSSHEDECYIAIERLVRFLKLAQMEFTDP